MTTTTDTLHLTRILIPCGVAADLRIRTSYQWHQRAWECFPGRDQEKRDFLSRLDEKDDHYLLILVGPVPPTRPEWCAENHFQSRAIGEGYFQHRRYAFQLRANPTKKQRPLQADGKRYGDGKRVSLVTQAECEAWLERKAATKPDEAGNLAGGGFRLLSVTSESHGLLRFEKHDRHGYHHSVDFTGELEVTHPSLFLATLRQGIGPAKAFGFGLLVIAPIS